MGTRAETTRKEKAILKFIENQVNKNGYPPSVREIGKALIGAKKGAEIEVEAPAGVIKYKILSIKK